MDVNKILSADILDIVFEGRNKEYGAYELRKTYNKRLAIALIVTASVILLMFGGYVLSNVLADKDNAKDVVVQDLQLEEIKQEEQREEPPPPPPPKPPDPP